MLFGNSTGELSKATGDGGMMSKYEKILIVLVMGSIWGALELFGGDLLRAFNVPYKSAFLFGFGLIILYASKRIGGFAGSVVIMALIAGLFKTVSSNFYSCQFAAVMINGAIFDSCYEVFKNRLDGDALYRIIAAPIITYVSYAIFAFGVTYILKEANWAARGMNGIIDYLTVDAVIATAISLITINMGYFLGNVLRPIVAERKFGMPAVYFRIASFIFVGAIWIAGQIY
jgi:hypothetical protein